MDSVDGLPPCVRPAPEQYPGEIERNSGKHQRREDNSANPF